MVEFEIVGQTYYASVWEVRSYIRYLEDVVGQLDKPFVIDVNHPEELCHDLTANYHDKVLYQVTDILLSFSNKKGFMDALHEITNEDVEWTKWRNKDLTYTAFRKYMFKPEIVLKAKEVFQEILNLLHAKLNEFERQQKAEKEEKEARKSLYRLGQLYTKQYSKGGEEGTDGYIDADIIHVASGQPTRFVMRDVFDFGCYYYPKRVEGTEGVFERDTWTEEERSVSKWLSEFSPFKGNIRM